MDVKVKVLTNCLLELLLFGTNFQEVIIKMH